MQPATAQQTEPFVEISITPAEVAVGEPVTMRVSVYVPTWFPKPPTFPSFEIPNAVTRLPPDSSRPSTARVGRDNWSGITRSYQIYPLLGARFSIENQAVAVQYANPGSDPIDIEVDTGEVSFVAIVPEGAETLEPYVAGTNLELTRRIEGDVGSLSVGDALVATYTAKLDGLSSMFLPELVGPADLPGVSVYPEQPVVRDDGTATRTEKLTYIFNAGGDFEIPAVTVDWWNRETSTIETAVVPALAVTVAGPPLQEEPAEDVADERNWWPVLAALALIGLFFRRLKTRTDEALDRYRDREKIRLASEPYAWDQARKAIGSGDAHRAHDEIVRWLARLEPGLDSRAFAERYGDDALTSELAALNRFLYAESAHSPDLGRIAQGLTVARRRCIREHEIQSDVVLPPLNP
jgi:hypothetical protein